MDSSNVLLALEEQKKWRERRKRIRERIHQLDRRKSTLRNELEGIRKKIVVYSRILLDRNVGTRPRPTIPPTTQGR
jgi:chromosome segregation ATPase